MMDEQPQITPVDTQFYYPNRMGRVLLQSTEDVLGRGGLLALLKLANLYHYASSLPPNNLDKKFSFEAVSALMQGIDLLYGPRGGRGVALRIGRVSFRYGLYEFGQVLGISDLIVRLLPWSIKFNRGANSLADLFNRFSDQVVRLEDTPDILYWNIERCPLCWGRQLTEPRCFAAVGLLEDALIWLSGGKSYLVEQTACYAAGDSHCAFTIEKKPLD